MRENHENRLSNFVSKENTVHSIPQDAQRLPCSLSGPALNTPMPPNPKCRSSDYTTTYTLGYVLLFTSATFYTHSLSLLNPSGRITWNQKNWDLNHYSTHHGSMSFSKQLNLSKDMYISKVRPIIWI